MAMPTAMNAGMKNALARAKVMMVAAAVEMSVKRMMFLSCCMVRGCPVILIMAGTFVSGYSALLASVEPDQNHYDQRDRRELSVLLFIYESLKLPFFDGCSPQYR